MVGLENPLHIALILIVVLMVFGAKRLPEMGKSMGSGIRGFKQAITGEEPDEPVTTAAQAPTVLPVHTSQAPVREAGERHATPVA
jgi:sec-independent protein translocase protein TatA